MGRGGQHDEDYEDYSEGEEEEMSTDEEGDEEEVEGEIAAGPRPVAGLGAGLPGLGVKSGPSAAAKKEAVDDVKPWAGLTSFPATTQNALHSLLNSLRGANKNELTILLLGKSGVGKSSTANTLFGEKVATINPFQNDTAKPVVISRKAAGFTINVIDTPSLLEADSVNESSLAAISFELRNRPVDVVMYMDRLDMYRVEPIDKMVIESVSRHFGENIWSNALIALSHGDMRSPPPGTDFSSYVEARAAGLRKAIKSAGGSGALPLVLVENSSRCGTNDEGQKVVGPNKTPWLTEMMSQVCEVVTKGTPAFVYDSKAQKKWNPNKKRRWLIPVIFAAQVAFKIFVFDKLVEEDAATGDQYGPFDPDSIETERERRKEEKERRDLERQQKEERRRRSNARANEPVLPSQPASSFAGFDDSEDEDWD